jgi:tetratricopeptide (TPR) repeat protein
MTTGTNKKQILFITASLVVTTLIAYEPMRHNEFINYDDTLYITKNPNVNEGITRESVIWAFTKQYAANWHPLTWLSHTLDCQIFGLSPFWHHLVSLIFHTTNALLLFWILTNITGTTWASAFVAAVFALHPIQVESVAWAAERKTVLGGLFWLLTILAYIWYTKRPSTGRYIVVFLVYGLCIMTKPVVVTLPLALLLLDYWPLERLNWVSRPAGKTVPAGRLLIEKVPLLVLSAVLVVATLIAQRSEGVVVLLENFPLDYRISNMFISYINYIGKMIWPSRLAVLYPFLHANIIKSTAVVCTLLFVLISVLSIYIGRRRKYAAFGWLWYVGTLVPMAGLVQVGSQAMADRYMYISMLGLLIIAAWAVKELVGNRPRWRIVAAVSAGVVLSSAIIITRMQVKHWQNSITLFEHTLKITENNPIAENNYGCALFDEGRVTEAIQHLSNAVRISPTCFDARKNLGKVLLRQGKLNEAIACFNELVKRRKESAEVYYNLAVASGMQGKYDDAIKYYAKTLDMDPKYPDAHGRMGTALLAAGRTKEAIAQLNEAVRINPDQVEAYINLGKAYSQLGKYEPAIQNWLRAVQLDANNVNTLNNLAWLLATADNISVQAANKAIEFAQRACELKGYNEPELLDTLGAAYAAGGRFNDAVTTARQAVDVAKARGREDLAGEIENRIKLYQSGQRYRQKQNDSRI